MTERTLATVARALEARADQPGVFSGYASLFGITDSQGDVVERGAFRASLESWRTKGRRPAMLWQHDPNEPIGLWTHLEEDAVGLRVEGRLLLSVRAGAEAHEHLKMGTVSGLSIGFQAIEAKRDRKSGIRRLMRVNLWEISLVTFPANHDARVADVKAGDDRLARALDRLAATRPVLVFKSSTDYQRLHGRPQPRDGQGQFADGGIGPTQVARLADRRGDARRPTESIDWRFIDDQEGGMKLEPYVPEGSDKSGVTIGSGVDLGQRDEADIRRLDMDEATKTRILAKIRPVLGLKGAAARASLDSVKGKLSSDEIEVLDAAVKRDIVRQARVHLKKNGIDLDALPREAQTAILSVAYNEGPNFKAPKLFGHVRRHDWRAAAAELRNWRTDPRKVLPGLVNRRKREADMMIRVLRGDVEPY